jgi:YjjG family noncanonical pyrimidine nucleotidase
VKTSQYKCILFDLDHTLWDYETNSSAALLQLYEKYKLASLGCVPCDQFVKHFTRINTELWDKHDRNQITRDVLRNDRFDMVFKSSGLDHRELSLQFSEEYLVESPKGKHLVPHAKELLDYLKAKGYSLYIVTNGFEEIQGTKIASGGITHYFDGIVTSARAGYKKPDKGIFEFVMSESGFKSNQSIMVGDNLLTDIAGARNASIDNVFYNPAKVVHNEQVTYEVSSLKELFMIL